MLIDLNLTVLILHSLLKYFYDKIYEEIYIFIQEAVIS
jgi:hypothetical protein